ncbi:MAG TPA: tRNA lysidine(34) synthetase TilS [Hydrogenophaga sp.]|uniref:tRNA lysidine(34) synthetase TilS n=1 Tax=Hydrogenophaga sp. TaxID=1904254 RepID=UPI002BC8894C|nr:tRNA lysidine(34) synthetase TilS [Hydrogenophaga sp.]HMN92989.1 tRNA lysidine(34) synthetase TilS [Hydrogenophaga sp.]HMP09125.1 tRNA lysidine(34) synthetase TilS [Hydrogenophaga sp.]
MRDTAADCDAALAGWLAGSGIGMPAQAPLAVALSGGADSTALLLAAARRWPGGVVALHVHHGLQAAANDFEVQVQALTGALGLPLHIERLALVLRSGDSPEEVARQGRYRALARMAMGAGAAAVLLGHQADDQAETVMLALGRGAGLPGLAAMAPRFLRHGVCFGRPLLGLRGDALRRWLRQQGVEFIEDPSNADPGLTRNRIRQELMPAWERCFPAFRDTVARSARHVAQAQVLLEELARMDLLLTGNPPAIAALQSLSRERQANALRSWIGALAGRGPSTAQLETLLDLLERCRTRGHRIHLKVADGWVEREGGHLRWTPPV